ncbi:hypothetical protein, variant [Aphanomyces astaci]|nr:hypothetical protein, variant [Aphanomyces astaci]ETV65721.1 hypothetical protein, variant [Aphanomyces astaci]|eukprot:XP_009844773.1 hypothetical protein, variant [Aphanomyces astaci]
MSFLACSNPPPSTAWVPPVVITVGDTVYLFLINLDVRRVDLLQSLSIDLTEVEHGSWRKSDGTDLPTSIRKVLLAAVEQQVGDWMVQHSLISWGKRANGDDGLVVNGEPTFEFRTLSSNRKDNWNTLRETAGDARWWFRLKVALSTPSQLVVSIVPSSSNQDWTTQNDALMRLHGVSQLADVWAVADTFSCDDALPRLVEKEKPRLKRVRDDTSPQNPVDVSKEVTDEFETDFDKDDDDNSQDNVVDKKHTPLLGQFDPDDEFLVPVAPELPSKGRQVCVEFPLQSGALPGLKRARKVQPFVRKLKKASKKADDPLSRVKFVNLEHATPSVPLREPATAHPLNLNKQALEWLARDVKAELSASKRTTSQSLGVATFTADVYKPAAHSSPRRYMHTKAIVPPSRIQQPTPDFREVDSRASPQSALPPCVVDVKVGGGARWLAKAAVVSWQTHQANGHDDTTSEHQLGVLTSLVEPHLSSLSHLYGAAPSHWLNAQEYLSHVTTQPPNGPLETHVLTPPSFVASKADSSHVALPPSLLPEWTLRSCAPIGGPKPVRLAVICPHSSGDWIATLSHMYMASLRTSYINASLGTFNDVDHETHKNALVIVNKSDDAADPFKTYREAVTDLGRTAFDTTASIFVVAPFGSKFSHRVTDFLGAISSQLDGWQPSFQVVYVEELVETCVHVQPTYFREQSFALYDRLYEPLPAGLAADAYACLPHGVTKKMYHLADPSAAFHVFLGYGLANGWLLSALVTSNGGVMATDAVFIDAPDLRAEDIALLVDKVLHFAALGRDQDAPAAVVATNALARINDRERAIWHDVWESKAIGDTQPVVVNQWVLSSAAVDGDLGWTNRQDADISRAVAVHDAGLIVPSKPANVHGLDRLSAAPNIVQLHVEAILGLSSAKVDGIPVGVTVEILKCFHDLAWLTVHPTTLRQASALPVHLFAVQNMLSLVAPRPTADKTIAHTK